MLELAVTSQENQWHCHDCLRWTFDVDKIIAWKPANLLPEPPLDKEGVADIKLALPRLYLVKWFGMSFRHVGVFSR